MPADLSPETIRKLNAINLDFYNKTALFFDNSRNYNWEGWDIMLKRLGWRQAPTDSWLNSLVCWLHLHSEKPKPNQELQVLDLGCGNGRFYGFLLSNLQRPFRYIGLDTNQFLIDKAKERYNYPNAQFIVENIGNIDHLFDYKFDLIVLFGVMHHIPGEQTRIKMLVKAKNLLANDGYLVFTTWKFLNIPRISKDIINPNTPIGAQIYQELGLSENELALHDYILDWKRGITAYRYCHYYTFEEVQELTKRASLRIVDTYEADGIEKDLNQYYFCQKQA